MEMQSQPGCPDLLFPSAKMGAATDPVLDLRLMRSPRSRDECGRHDDVRVHWHIAALRPALGTGPPGRRPRHGPTAAGHVRDLRGRWRRRVAPGPQSSVSPSRAPRASCSWEPGHWTLLPVGPLTVVAPAAWSPRGLYGLRSARRDRPAGHGSSDRFLRTPSSVWEGARPSTRATELRRSPRRETLDRPGRSPRKATH